MSLNFIVHGFPGRLQKEALISLFHSQIEKNGGKSLINE